MPRKSNSQRLPFIHGDPFLGKSFSSQQDPLQKIPSAHISTSSPTTNHPVSTVPPILPNKGGIFSASLKYPNEIQPPSISNSKSHRVDPARNVDASAPPPTLQKFSKLKPIKNSETLEASSSRVDLSEKNGFFSHSSLQPKVMLSYISRPSETPRRIEIERRKRLYLQQDIEQLLQTHNVHLPPFQGKDSFISIFDCDNTEFEERSVSEWLNVDEELMLMADGSSIIQSSVPIPASLFQGEKWLACEVVAYDLHSHRWGVTLVNNSKLVSAQPQLQWVHRFAF